MTDRPYGSSTETWPQTPVAETPTTPASTQDATPPDGSTTEVAKDQAHSVASDAKQSGQQVAQTAKEQTQEVASEAKYQARELYQQLRGEVGDQAATQHQRAASGLHTLGDELGSMARGSDQSGVATDLAQQAADRVHSLAGWLESREPGDVLDEVTSFARRKPGTFLAAAAAIGFLGGRLTRGLAADPSDTGAAGGGTATGTATTPAVRASGTDVSAGGNGYNPGPATAAPQATSQPTPLPDEPTWPAPGGVMPPSGVGSSTGTAPGTGEERI
jgi:hypothetical protein